MARLFIVKGDMKIVVTVEQLKRILVNEPVHLPIIIKMDKISRKDFEELTVLLNQDTKKESSG